MAQQEEFKFYDILNRDYSNTTFSSMLWELFGKHDEAIEAYIKPDREFWHYDGEKGRYLKLKVTYIRTHVMFFFFEDEPEIEHAWFINSMNCFALKAAQIYPYEIGEILSKWYEDADRDFPQICKQCKWEELDGRIKVKVIWDK